MDRLTHIPTKPSLLTGHARLDSLCYIGYDTTIEDFSEETDYRDTIFKALVLLGSELPENKRKQLMDLIDTYCDNRGIQERWKYKGEENA